MLFTTHGRFGMRVAFVVLALFIGAACSDDCDDDERRADERVSAWHWNVFNRENAKTVTPGPAVTTTPVGVLATAPPANQRYASTAPITAVFNPATFTTTYTLKMTGGFPEGGRVRWTGVNCGSTTGDDYVIGPGNADGTVFTSTFAWTHPHPPCGNDTAHLDATVTATLTEGGTTPNTTLYRTTCIYRGAESGTGPTCELRR